MNEATTIAISEAYRKDMKATIKGTCLDPTHLCFSLILIAAAFLKGITWQDPIEVDGTIQGWNGITWNKLQVLHLEEAR